MWQFFSRDPLKDFAYDIGEKYIILDDKSLWSFHDGKKKSNGEAVSIFAFDVKNGTEEQCQQVKMAMKRMKTLRHPNILTYLDGLETEKSCIVVTEPVKPLLTHIANDSEVEEMWQLSVSWGLHQIVKALVFLNEDCSVVHTNICPTAVFVDAAGEWKLGGFEFSFNFSADRLPKNMPALLKYNPPELEVSTKKSSQKWSEDSWGLACLIWEVFNGPFSKNTSLKSPGKIPKNLHSQYTLLINANPKNRISAAKFLEECRTPNAYMDNNFISTMLFLDHIQIQDQESKTKFFNGLGDILDSIPVSFCRLKILPQLILAFEFGSAGSAVLTPLFKLGRLLDAEEYQKKMVPCVVKLFSSTDRSTRVKLLQQLEFFIEFLSQSIVNKEIFPSVATGFLDSNPVVREQTIKSMLHLAPKLDYKNLNEELLKHFSRLQAKDEQGGIRTNTTVCLGKIACYLNPQVRQRVLSSAFLRALKDPFPPARQAGILALAATHNFFTLQESAHRLLPALVSLTLDPDKTVREHVFKTIKCFLAKLESISEHPEKREQIEKDVLSGGVGTPASGGWAGWAVSGMSTLTSKIYSAKQTNKPTTLSKEQATTENKDVDLSKKIIDRKATSLASNQAKQTIVENLKDEEESEEEKNDWGEEWGDMEDMSVPESTLNSKTIPDGSEEKGFKIDDDDDDENWGDIETPVDPRRGVEFVPDDEEHITASSYNWDSHDSTSSLKKQSDDDFFFNSLVTDNSTSVKSGTNKLKLSKTNEDLKPSSDISKNRNPPSTLLNSTQSSHTSTQNISSKLSYSNSGSSLSTQNNDSNKVESSKSFKQNVSSKVSSSKSDGWDNDAWGALDAWAQEDTLKDTSKTNKKK